MTAVSSLTKHWWDRGGKNPIWAWIGHNGYVGTNGSSHDILLPPVGFSHLFPCAQNAHMSEMPLEALHPPVFPAANTYVLLADLCHPYLGNVLPSPPCLIHSKAPFRTWFKQVISYPSTQTFFLGGVICSSFAFYLPHNISTLYWFNYLISTSLSFQDINVMTAWTMVCLTQSYSHSNWHLSA